MLCSRQIQERVMQEHFLDLSPRMVGLYLLLMLILEHGGGCKILLGGGIGSRDGSSEVHWCGEMKNNAKKEEEEEK